MDWCMIFSPDRLFTSSPPLHLRSLLLNAAQCSRPFVALSERKLRQAPAYVAGARRRYDLH